MARQENPPFRRGETFGGLNPAVAVAVTDGAQEEGAEWYFNDKVWSNPAGTVGAIADRTNRLVRCRIVRNVSGINLLPKRLANLQIAGTDGRFAEGRVDGYATATAARCYPIDEFLPAAGVANNDLFWLVLEGPATVRTPLSALANVINVGDGVVALTAVTSQSTTAGRASAQDLTGATALLANQILNMIGRALSAVTTANTDSDLLIDVGKY